MSSIVIDRSGARIGGTDVKLTLFSESVESQIEAKVSDFRGVAVSDFPDMLICDFTPDKVFQSLSSYSYQIYRADGAFHFNINIDEEADVWNDVSINSVYRELVRIVKHQSAFSPYIGMPADEGWMHMTYDITQLKLDLCEVLTEFLTDASSLVERALVSLRGNVWKEEYSKDEPLFTKEFVVPLLVSMGFEYVRYNHGVEEFGKDVLFSERDRFGNQRYLAAQIKAGSVSGKSGGLMDKILGQIKHAFTMPVEGPGQQRNFHISEMFIICSGGFTNNAIKIINSQVDPALKGSLYFLDKQDLEWLQRRHM